MIPFYPVKPIRGGRPLDGLFEELAADPEWTCQAKLNGKRALWDGRTLWSREGNAMHRPFVVSTLNQQGLDVTLDGELVGTGAQSTFYVFDLPDFPFDLQTRLAVLNDFIGPRLTGGLLRMCPMGVTWDDVEHEGWEGVVFKKLSSMYPKADRPDVETANWVKYRKEWL